MSRRIWCAWLGDFSTAAIERARRGAGRAGLALDLRPGAVYLYGHPGASWREARAAVEEALGRPAVDEEARP